MRPTRHRRRFHTDRIVRVRRARYLRESRPYWLDITSTPWFAKRMSYGMLASRDPWDCGRARCGICHWSQWESRRAREKRAWRNDWGV